MRFQPATKNLHQPPASPKQPHLNRVCIQLENLANLVHGESGDFLHHQHGPVLLVQFDQEPIQQVPLFRAARSIYGAMAEGTLAILGEPYHMTNLLITQARLVDQRANFLLAKIIPAFVYGDLVEPSSERRAQIEALKRKIRFQKRLLRYVLNVFVAAHDAANHGKQARLVDADQLFISRLIASLGTPYQVAFCLGIDGCAADGARNTRADRFRLHFWDVRHENSVTASCWLAIWSLILFRADGGAWRAVQQHGPLWYVSFSIGAGVVSKVFTNILRGPDNSKRQESE